MATCPAITCRGRLDAGTPSRRAPGGHSPLGRENPPRRASGVHTLVELEDLAEELAERFGEPPEPALNLLGLSRIKLLARSVGATAVNYRSGTLSITGVTLSAAAPALVRKATGGVFAG